MAIQRLEKTMMSNVFREATHRFMLPIDLQPGQLVCLTSGPGVDVAAGTERLWLTAEHEAHDVFLVAGQSYRTGGGRCSLISADAPTRFTVRGEADRTTHVSLIHANGEREVLHPAPQARRTTSPHHAMKRRSTVSTPSAPHARMVLGAALAVVFSGLTAIVFAGTRFNATADTRQSVVARCDAAARSAAFATTGAEHASDAQWRRLRDRAFAQCLDTPPDRQRPGLTVEPRPLVAPASTASRS